jgi:azurin
MSRAPSARARRAAFHVALACAALLSACTPHSAAVEDAVPPAVVELPVTLNGNVQVVQLTGNDTMHYDGNHITVHNGQPVLIELTNIGHTPRDQMAHNFVLLKPGSDVFTFNLLSAQAKNQGYMPAELMGQVVANTTFAGPGETVQVQFPAPAPGQYPFLCNFPGHYAAGMHGVMLVTP